MSVRPTKRPRTRSVARQEREEAPSLASVLLPVVQQGFLGHQELGQLGQTSRQLNTQCKQELWKSLCCRRWPITSKLSAQHVISRGGYSGCYRHMISPVREHSSEPPPLDPPSLKLEHVEFVVDVTRDGETLVSDMVSGGRLQYLLEDGAMVQELVNPAVLGKAACFLQGICSCEAGCRFRLLEDDFQATVQLFRSDGTSCRIYQSMKRDPRYCCGDDTRVRFPVDESSKWWKEPKLNHMELGPGVPNTRLGLPLRWTPVAAEIYRRLQCSLSFEFWSFVEIIEHYGEKVAAITAFEIDIYKRPIGGSRLERFKSNKEAKKHGVTLLHILQELQSI